GGPADQGPVLSGGVPSLTGLARRAVRHPLTARRASLRHPAILRLVRLGEEAPELLFERYVVEDLPQLGTHRSAVELLLKRFVLGPQLGGQGLGVDLPEALLQLGRRRGLRQKLRPQPLGVGVKLRRAQTRLVPFVPPRLPYLVGHVEELVRIVDRVSHVPVPCPG